MTREPIQSSSIVSAGYDANAGILELEFSSKAVYQYKNVPMNVWEGFRRAESKGRFFAVDIRACFEFECVYKPPKQEKTNGEKHTEPQPEDTPKPGQKPKPRKARIS